MLSLFTDISHTWIVFLTQNPSAFVHTVGYFWSALEPSEDGMNLNQSVMVWHHWYVPSRHGMRVCSMTVRRVPQYILLSSIGLHDTWWSRVPATARDRGESQRPKKWTLTYTVYTVESKTSKENEFRDSKERNVMVFQVTPMLPVGTRAGYQPIFTQRQVGLPVDCRCGCYRLPQIKML